MSTDDPPAPTRRSITNALVDACHDAGSAYVFGVPGGGSNLDLVGAATTQGLQFVLAHTETAAAIMAGVVGELTGAPGVCLATRGPGAASAVNGVAQAMLDRQPLIAVTDCVAEADRARVSHQYIDQQALMAPVTKASVVLDGRRPGAAQRAVQHSLSGRPGAVHIDIDPGRATPVDLVPDTAPPPADSGPALKLVAAARRPVIVAGVGVIAQSLAARTATIHAIATIGETHHVPVLCTYKARGVAPDSSSWCAGVATGATIESAVLHEADLIIGVGLDPVELIPAAWVYDAPVVLLSGWPIDDSSFFGHHLAADVVGPPADLVEQVLAVLHTDWLPETGQAFRRQSEEELRGAVPAIPTALTPQEVVEVANGAAAAGTIATVDAGAHMLVAVPLWSTDAPGELLISSGLATMGFALPAAIAAALVHHDRRVVCFTGDAGIGMALAELETVARLHLPITVIVFNDSTLSLIAAKQHPTDHGGDVAVKYWAIDFAAVARACGVEAERVHDVAAYDRAVRASFARSGPTLLDVAVDPSAYGAVLDAVRGVRHSSPGRGRADQL